MKKEDDVESNHSNSLQDDSFEGLVLDRKLNTIEKPPKNDETNSRYKSNAQSLLSPSSLKFFQ